MSYATSLRVGVDLGFSEVRVFLALLKSEGIS